MAKDPDPLNKPVEPPSLEDWFEALERAEPGVEMIGDKVEQIRFDDPQLTRTLGELTAKLDLLFERYGITKSPDGTHWELLAKTLALEYVPGFKISRTPGRPNFHARYVLSRVAAHGHQHDLTASKMHDLGLFKSKNNANAIFPFSWKTFQRSRKELRDFWNELKAHRTYAENMALLFTYFHEARHPLDPTHKADVIVRRADMYLQDKKPT